MGIKILQSTLLINLISGLHKEHSLIDEVCWDTGLDRDIPCVEVHVAPLDSFD
jgi:hypothetical protein